ncbi:ABC transporter permease [Nesterenkonia sp. E16_7]|uniref:ABC transporter permease n=1 Tax=unclassified Nesterenkonia TaxID=2629769 RepID=UPI001A932F39|nr:MULTISPECIES: ABC transporter permease [unclassified Nesterenkonia]MBO0594893.1 ABC transporter permease [Nesterenkonia sp. E16_10]MBO0599829.1 ABC transporter permease [Nesterenkonia sp. E16_7]
MLTIARSELRQILRNRMVFFSATVIPVGLSLLFIAQRDAFSQVPTGMGFLAGAFMMILISMGLYSTAVTTLAARRQTLFLKRLRSTAVSDPVALAGILGPPALIGIIQVTAVLSVLAALTEAPAEIPLLIVSGLSLVLMMLGLALATAGVTTSPEHAQVTTLPVTMGTSAVAFWIGFTGTEELGMLKRALPGGAATELTINAWNGGTDLVDNLLLLPPTLGWVVIGVLLAKRFFRWEPRH